MCNPSISCTCDMRCFYVKIICKRSSCNIFIKLTCTNSLLEQSFCESLRYTYMYVNFTPPTHYRIVVLLAFSELSLLPPTAYPTELCAFLVFISVAIGLLYPFCDRRLGETVHRHRREWASVMRCVAVFVGINHASAVSFFC